MYNGDDDDMQGIKNFLYLDEYQMYSMSSQVFEGITESLVDSQTTTSEDEEKQKGPVFSARTMANILKTESTRHENKHLHDYSFTLFERQLKEANNVTSISSESIGSVIDGVDTAGFIEVRGKAAFNDMNIIKSTIEGFNRLGEALAYVQTVSQMESAAKVLEELEASVGDRNQSAQVRQMRNASKNIKSVAEELGLRQDPKLLEEISYLLDYGMKDQFEVQMRLGSYTCSANLKREFLREDEHMLVRKYSRLSQKEFVLFGTVAQSPTEVVSTTGTGQEGEREQSSDQMHLKVVLMQLVETLSEMESTFSGRMDNEIVIDPIALYREI